MGIDVDYIAAKQAIETLKELLNHQGHGKREKIADDIIEFTEKMKIKWDKMEKQKRIQKIRHNSNEIYTELTTSILNELGFNDNGQSKFELFEGMSYWVKSGVCLFYNTPVNEDFQDSFYIGYAEMRQGKYVAVAFRWINSLEELTQIYEGITRKLITEPI